MKLLIVSNMAHYLAGGTPEGTARSPAQVLGWGPAVREISHLAGLFDEVRHLAVLDEGPPPAIAMPYSSPKVTFVPLPRSGGKGVWAKLGILLRTPQYVARCLHEFRRADAVHLRCPSNLGLEALLLLRVVRHPQLRWAKYAGNWRPSGPEPFFYRLQRKWLEQGVHGGLVTINGDWPSLPPHVHPLHNPCLTESGLTQAELLTRHKQLSEPFRLLFAGALLRSKGADRALRILSVLRERGWRATLDLAGDGPQLRELQELAAHLAITKNVAFHGWLTPDALQQLYQQAHFLVLPTQTEGFPKVVGEAMAFRAVPLAGAVSCIPQILHETRAGVALPPGDVLGFVAEIEKLARDPAAWRRMAANGPLAAADFTYEAYVRRVGHLLRLEPAQPEREDQPSCRSFREDRHSCRSDRREAAISPFGCGSAAP